MRPKNNIKTTLSDLGLLVVDATREIRNFFVAAFIVDRLQVLENADDLKVFLVNLNGEKTFDSMVHYPFIYTRLSQFRSLIKNRTHDEFHLPGPVWLRITLPPAKPCWCARYIIGDYMHAMIIATSSEQGLSLHGPIEK